jgi:plastocyanin
MPPETTITMRTLRILAAVAALALSVAACSSASSPGWTFSPTEQPTPAPSQPSGAPPTAVPGATNPVTGGSQGDVATGTTVNLVALNIAFDQTQITVPANTTFTINFDNQDSGIPHNVAIHKDSPTGEAVFTGEIITGPAQKVYTIGGLNAGTYAFVCTVHPNMVGTLTVTP